MLQGPYYSQRNCRLGEGWWSSLEGSKRVSGVPQKRLRPSCFSSESWAERTQLCAKSTTSQRGWWQGGCNQTRFQEEKKEASHLEGRLGMRGEAQQVSAPGFLVSAAGLDPLAQKPESPGSRASGLEVRAQRREVWPALGVGEAGAASQPCPKPLLMPLGRLHTVPTHPFPFTSETPDLHVAPLSISPPPTVPGPCQLLAHALPASLPSPSLPPTRALGPSLPASFP